MAHLPIRKKPAPADALNLLPMATILAAGVLATLFWKAGQRPPEQALRDVAHAMPVLTAARPAVSLEAVKAHVFTVDGRAWVAAPVPPVQFKAEELLPGGSQDGFGLVMNRERGLPELNQHPHAYDRLYVDLHGAGFAPLRWRDVPPKR